MFLTEVDAEEASGRRMKDPGSSMAAIVVGTATKIVMAALAGMMLACGLGLLIWSVTPSSGSGPLPLLRAGIAAFCAANGMTLEVERSSLTLHPLMLSLVAVALLTTVSGRGRVTARGREQETAVVVTSALAYAIVITGIGVGLGGHAVSAAQWWRPSLLALVVVGITTLVRSDGWRVFVLDRLPLWVPVSIRCGGAAMAALLGGGAVTLVIGLIRTFGDSNTVQDLAAPGAAGGLGMAVLGIAYLPNAVVAATGYSTGVGFTIGGGTYTPFGSSPVELPAVSLLTAAPDGRAFAWPTLLLLLFPVLAALLIGRDVVRRLDNRRDRLFGAAGAALFAATLSAIIGEIAGGGVTGGEWSTAGVPPALFGFVVLAALGTISAPVVVLARVRAVVGVALAREDLDEADLGSSDEVAQNHPVAHDELDAVDELGAVSVAGGDAEVPEVSSEPGQAAGLSADEIPVEVSEQTAARKKEAITSSVPTPREEDIVARDLAVAQDADATLAAGLSREAAQRRTG